MSNPLPASGRTSADDPGLLRSMGTGTPLGQMRAVAVVFSAVPVLIGALLPLVLDDSDPGVPPAVGAGVVVVVAALSALVQALAVPRQFTPPGPAAARPGEDAPPSRTPVDQAREGVFQLRAALFLRLALSESAVLVGFVMCFATGGALPYAVGFVLGWPMMLLAVPTAGQVERARERMQAGSVVPVPLWDALLTRAV